MSWIDKANITFNSDGTVAGTRVIAHGMRDGVYVEDEIGPIERIEYVFDADGPVCKLKVILAPGNVTVPIELVEFMQRQCVYVVRYQNVEPAEVDSIWWNEADAYEQAEKKGRDWTVDTMVIG